jgi:sarcosine oxidase
MELSRRKVSVVGLDRFKPPHTFGSHSGDTRVFRTAYAEHPDYVPLAEFSGQLWDQYGAQAGTCLLTRCGQLNVGPADDAMMKGIRHSADLYSIAVERLNADEIRKRFPAIEVMPGHIGLLDTTAGWIDVNRAIEFGLSEAKRAGAEIMLDCAVSSWDASNRSVVLHTDHGEIEAGQLLITAGAWAGSLLPQLPITIEHRVLVWIDPLEPAWFSEELLPVFTFAERFFYGFPNIGGKGVKIALHWIPGHPLPDPANLPMPTDKDLEQTLEFASRYLPKLAGPLPGAIERVLRSKSCLYAMTPDEHFIIDRHPLHENVRFAAGFSGHGFKFAPAIARALADLAIDGHTDQPIGFCRMSREYQGSR